MSVFNHKFLAVVPFLALLAMAPQEVMHRPLNRSFASFMEKTPAKRGLRTFINNDGDFPVLSGKPEASVKVRSAKKEVSAFPKIEAKTKGLSKNPVVVVKEVKAEKVDSDITAFEASLKESKRDFDSLIIKLAQLESDLKSIPESEKDKAVALKARLEKQKEVLEGILPSESEAVIVKEGKEGDKKEVVKKEDKNSEEKATEDCATDEHQALLAQVKQLAADQKNIMQILLNMTQTLVNMSAAQQYNPMISGSMVPYHHLYNYSLPGPLIYGQQQPVAGAPGQQPQQAALQATPQQVVQAPLVQGPISPEQAALIQAQNPQFLAPNQLMNATPMIYSPLVNFEQTGAQTPGTFGNMAPRPGSFGAAIL